MWYYFPKLFSQYFRSHISTVWFPTFNFIVSELLAIMKKWGIMDFPELLTGAACNFFSLEINK